jgi:hypothetical protein
LGYILVSSSNKTDCHVITEILFKVALKHHNPHPNPLYDMPTDFVLFLLFSRCEGVEMGLKHPKFRILIMSAPGFLPYEISLPCFSVRFCQVPMVSEVKTVKGANTLNDC